MNTLREIGEFIGMSPGTSLRSASDLVISPGEQISMREVIRRLPNLPKEPPTPPPLPLPSPKEPTISATTEGAGMNTVLVVTGSGFLPILPNRIVTVRVVDDALNPERNFQQSSTPSGELKMRINLPCNSGLPFHVSATDSRPGPGTLGVVFSNTVTLLCP